MWWKNYKLEWSSRITPDEIPECIWPLQRLTILVRLPIPTGIPWSVRIQVHLCSQWNAVEIPMTTILYPILMPIPTLLEAVRIFVVSKGSDATAWKSHPHPRPQWMWMGARPRCQGVNLPFAPQRIEFWISSHFFDYILLIFYPNFFTGVYNPKISSASGAAMSDFFSSLVPIFCTVIKFLHLLYWFHHLRCNKI